MLRLSPCAAEALNYQLMQDCALPMATLLAVGEERKFFLLRNAFIVTEFADGFRDGRDFMPDGAMKDRNDLANEFILRNLALLARCHDCGILHRGFTPANLLYKIRQTPDENGHWLDLIWIDVASCRKRFPVQINHSLREELNRFFHFFSFTPEEMDNYIKYYLQARKNHRPASKYLKNFY